MGNLIQWQRPSMLSLQRDIEDILEEFPVSRSFRREMTRLFDEVSSPRTLWREMDRLLEEFESPPALGSRLARMFENVVQAPRRYLTPWRSAFVPSVELAEFDSEYVMKVDLPGLRENEIDLKIDDHNVLTICGERHVEETKEARGYEYSERAYGGFSRSVALPSGIETGKIDADFRNGVLEIHVPKTEAARARRIPLTREEPRVMPVNKGAAAQVQASRLS